MWNFYDQISYSDSGFPLLNILLVLYFVNSKSHSIWGILRYLLHSNFHSEVRNGVEHSRHSLTQWLETWLFFMLFYYDFVFFLTSAFHCFSVQCDFSRLLHVRWLLNICLFCTSGKQYGVFCVNYVLGDSGEWKQTSVDLYSEAKLWPSPESSHMWCFADRRFCF